jgi:hypothetical protein
MKLKRDAIIGIVAVIAILSIAVIALLHSRFASGLDLSKTDTNSTPISSSSSQRSPGTRAGFVTGSIETLNDNGFTLTLPDGTTKDIQLSATTTIQDYTGASSTPTTITSDQLSVGEQVSVVGTSNDDGSVSARMVRTGTVPMRHQP